jgi:hypothetical protein
VLAETVLEKVPENAYVFYCTVCVPCTGLLSYVSRKEVCGIDN